MIAAGGYGNYPVHFINGVFRATQDNSKWSNGYWYWNQRDVYNSFSSSNHPELMRTFNNLYARNYSADRGRLRELGPVLAHRRPVRADGPGPDLARPHPGGRRRPHSRTTRGDRRRDRGPQPRPGPLLDHRPHRRRRGMAPARPLTDNHNAWRNHSWTPAMCTVAHDRASSGSRAPIASTMD